MDANLFYYFIYDRQPCLKVAIYFSHLTELKNIYITEIYMKKKKIQIINNLES